MTLIALSAMLFSTVVSAACPADLDTLRADLVDARMAYGREDLDELLDAVERVDEDLGCMTEWVTPEDALQTHVVHALGYWLLRDEDRTIFALRGALTVDPVFVIGDDIAPPGSQLTLLYVKARQEGPGLSVPSKYPVSVDGFRGLRAVPASRATLIQYETEDGLQTIYSSPDGPPSALVAGPPFGWLDEGKVLKPVLGEQQALTRLNNMASQGVISGRIAARLNNMGMPMGAIPWSAALVREQVEIARQGALIHTRERRKTAESMAIDPSMGLD